MTTAEFGRNLLKEGALARLPSCPDRAETTQEIAQRLQTGIEKLYYIFNQPIGSEPYSKCRALLSVISGAVSQVATGSLDRVHFGVAAIILDLQEEMERIRNKYETFTCYHDVVRVREEIRKAIELNPSLNEISQKLVDYRPVEQERL